MEILQPSPLVLDDQEFNWPWKAGQERLTYADIEKYLRESTGIDALLKKGESSLLYEGVYTRPEMYPETAGIKAPLYVFTGALDLQTPVSEVENLRAACKRLGKKDCFIDILPGLGHGFSPPRGPRRHPLADLTVGPVSSSLTGKFDVLAKTLGR